MPIRMSSTSGADVGTYRRLRIEHAIYQFFDRHNRAALADPRRVDAPGRGTVTLSRMAELRRQAWQQVCDRALETNAHGYADRLASSGVRPGSVAAQTVLCALDEDAASEVASALADAIEAGGDTGARPRVDFSEALTDFDDVLGISGARREADGSDVVSDDLSGVLVSPIDPAWGQRLALQLSHGHEAVLLARDIPDTLATGAPAHLRNLGGRDANMADVRPCEWPLDYFNGPGNEMRPVFAGTRGASGLPERGTVDGKWGIPSYSWVDQCGLTRLARYASSDDEFKRIVARSRSAWEHAPAEDVANMRRACAQMTGVLDRLILEGHDVRLADNPMSGAAVDAIVDGSVQVRVHDRPGDARYLGRSYVDGTTWRLADVPDPASDAARQLEAHVSEAKRESLVRLALDERPPLAVAGGAYNNDARSPRLSLGSLDATPGEVVCTWSPASRYRGFDANDPMAFVTKSVADAREHIARSVDVDAVEDAIARGEQPAKSGNSLVSRLREDVADAIRHEGREAADARLETWLDENVGTVEGAREAGRFDVAAVSRWGNGDRSRANYRYLVLALERESELAKADPVGHRDMGEALARLRGGSDGRGQRFDEATARHMGDASVGPFQAKALSQVAETLRLHALDVADVAIDDAGTIRWQAAKTVATRTGQRTVPVTGVVGPVFEPDATGEVHCDVRGKRPFDLEPAWSASIVPTRLAADGPAKSVYERMVLTSDLDRVLAGMRHEVSRSLSQLGGGEGTSADGIAEVGSAGSLAPVWASGLVGETHPSDERRVTPGEGRYIDTRFDAVRKATERGRVHMDAATHDGSSTYAIITHVENPDADAAELTCDVCPKPELAAVIRCGLTDMSSMSNPQTAGIFDQSITAQGAAQGVNKTLVEGASVGEDGHIVRSADPDDRAPLTKDPLFAEQDHDTWLRQQLGTSNVMGAIEVTKPVRVAHMAFGGFEQDDAIVVSKAFAERYQVHDGEGRMRPLGVNDKLSDTHGNKGLVSLVVDPDMADGEAERLGVRAQRDLFRANPGLSLVMSPFSFISRGNAGTAREGMASPHDLVIPRPDGTAETVPGGSCDLHMVVQSHTVEEKSSVYDTDDSRGRLVGWQLTAGLASAGADGLLREMFAGNEGGLDVMRDAMRVVGLDLRPDGSVTDRPSVDDHPTFSLDIPKGAEVYMTKTGEAGCGFRHRQPNGRVSTQPLFRVQEETANARQLPRESCVMPVAMPLTIERGESSRVPLPTSPDGTGIVCIPAYGLRGNDADGSFGSVDAGAGRTRDYVRIAENDVRYRMLRDAAATAADPKPYLKAMDRLVDESQAALDGIVESGRRNLLESHDNVFKRYGLGCRVGHSATLPWSPDPRLDIEQLAVGADEARRLGIGEGDPVVLWRDPVLTSDCVRAFEAHVEPSIHGVQVNPVVAGVIGGDFDGDTVGLYVPQTQAGRDACEAISFERNLVDERHVSLDRDGNETHPLSVGVGLDVRLAQSVDPSLAKDLEDVRSAADSPAELAEAGRAALGDYALDDKEAMRAGRRAVLADVNSVIHDAQRTATCVAPLRYDSAEGNVRSIYDACVATHVKGSEAKLVGEYCRNLGVTVDGGRLVDDDGRWRDGCVIDDGATHLTREQNEATQFATHAKAAYTGVSGYAMQLGLTLAGTRDEVWAANCLAEQIYQHTLDYKTNDGAARSETPAIAVLADTLKGAAYKIPVERVRNVHGDESPHFERDASVKRGSQTPEQVATQYRYVSKDVFHIVPNDQALETVSRMPTLHSQDFLNEGRGGSSMHVLAFAPKNAVSQLETYAKHGDRLYDGPVTAAIEPRSVEDAKIDAVMDVSRHDPEPAPAPRDDGRTAGSVSTLTGVDYAAMGTPVPVPERQRVAEPAAERHAEERHAAATQPRRPADVPVRRDDTPAADTGTPVD